MRPFCCTLERDSKQQLGLVFFTMKKSFVLYSDFKATLDKLPDNEAGKLFKLILDFVNGIEVQPDSLLLEVVFEPIKQQMKRDQEKYAEELEKRSDAGLKSAGVKAFTKELEALKTDDGFLNMTLEQMQFEKGRCYKYMNEYYGTHEHYKYKLWIDWYEQQIATKSTRVESVEQVLTKSSDNVNENVIVNDTVNENEINIYIPSVSSKPKKKHLFKHSEYFEFDKFTEAFTKTKCFARHPNLDLERIHTMMVNSEAKNYMYVNWIMATENWVDRDPSKYIKTIKSVIEQDPLFSVMTKGDIKRAEHDAKMAIQRKLLNNGDDPYTY